MSTSEDYERHLVKYTTQGYTSQGLPKTELYGKGMAYGIIGDADGMAGHSYLWSARGG